MTDATDKPKKEPKMLPEVLPPDAAKQLEAEIGEDGVRKVEGVLIASQVTMGGPLPVSSEFAAYENVLPGAAREILDMAKAEQAHRHKSNTKDLNGGITHQFLALILGASLLGGCLWGAVYLAMNGQPLVASLFLGVAVLGVVTSIIRSRPVFTGRLPEVKEDETKEI